MSGGTKGHNRAALNLYSELVDRVDGDGCEINTSDVKIKVNEGLSYRYPDLVVSCDERDKSEAEFYQFPKLIVEVLSSSTEAVDRAEKFQEYIQIPMLEEYVLISTKRMQVECFRRLEGRTWGYLSYSYLSYKEGEMVEIVSVGVELPIEKLYRNVRLDIVEAKQAL